ncbi:putative F-box protein At3g25750 [Mercurialis annua]|uniref:putative F-box protein At3g25750 n=1 Tax=Mercurialis annua TaxID=3986 RepID=UPI002160D600|nr:putative F-box protein At3g25750 [Mercurialis annua]
MAEGTKSRWPDLPTDILASIIKLLEVRIDIIRIGSVCRSWRNSIFYSREDQIVFPLKTPLHNIYLSQTFSLPKNTFLQFYPTSMYLIKPIYDDSRTAFLVKVEHHYSGRHKARLLDLFSQENDIYGNEVIDSRNYHVSELCKMCTWKSSSERGSFYLNSTDHKIFKKVILYPDDVWTTRENCVVFAIDSRRKLEYWKFGDEKWTTICNAKFGDMILYNGKVCATEYTIGHIWVIEISSNQVIKIALHEDFSRYNCAFLKSCGDLYLVGLGHSIAGIAKYPVYKLNIETPCRNWVRVACIGGGDRIFVLASQHTSSFSVSTNEFVRSEGNKIYKECFPKYYTYIECPWTHEQRNLQA